MYDGLDPSNILVCGFHSEILIIHWILAEEGFYYLATDFKVSDTVSGIVRSVREPIAQLDVRISVTPDQWGLLKVRDTSRGATRVGAGRV